MQETLEEVCHNTTVEDRERRSYLFHRLFKAGDVTAMVLQLWVLAQRQQAYLSSTLLPKEIQLKPSKEK